MICLLECLFVLFFFLGAGWGGGDTNGSGKKNEHLVNADKVDACIVM